MFSESEAQYLDKLLESRINEKQAGIADSQLNDKDRDTYEREIIRCVSIASKLSKDLPKPKQKLQARVLIVEDVESMRKVNQHILMSAGFNDVDVAADGIKAMQQLAAAHAAGKPYGLIISDWEMPRMTGLELLKAVRKDPDIWRTPFFLLTSLIEKTYIMDAIKADASGYMAKPFTPQIIQSKLTEFL